eukprot:8699355-Alexandrium_andersonii.AAC.1
MTFEALAAAFENLDQEGKNDLRVVDIELCIYLVEQVDVYRRALLAAPPAKAPGPEPNAEEEGLALQLPEMEHQPVAPAITSRVV